MEPKVEITPALLNDKAFAFLERFVHDDVTDTSLLFNVEIELASGINAIKAAWELAQAKVVTVVPLLEDAAAWQYQFEWKSIFDQVFEVSREGTLLRSLGQPWLSVVSLSLLVHAMPPLLRLLPPATSPMWSSPPSFFIADSQKLAQIPPLSMPSKASKNEQVRFPISGYFCTGEQEDKEDKEEDELDDEANCCPRVTEIPPLGHANLTQQLESLFRCYSGEGSAEGSRAKASAGPSSQCRRSYGGGYESDSAKSIQGRAALWIVLQHFKLEGLKCKTFHWSLTTFMWKLPACKTSDSGFPLHANLVPQIMPVPMEEMEPFAQPSDIPVHSWVHLLTSGLKNEIAYVKHVEGENSAAHWELFDVDLACQHGLERHNVERGDSVDVIASPHRGFEGMVLSVDVIEDMALLCGNRTTGKSGYSE
ncbi:hypothetical protein BKA82DRAFT_4021430 [Pisolithus tinctorius]|nr:hypothetical protein BKA82DRAFT_4021430 [Pisolithus tinctorius]